MIPEGAIIDWAAVYLRRDLGASLSVAAALLIPPHIGWLQALPGMIYGVLGIVMPVVSIRYARRIHALAAQREAA